jgi:hypothetical protein
MTRAVNAYPISRNPRRCRSSPVPDSSQITTVDAPISISDDPGHVPAQRGVLQASPGAASWCEQRHHEPSRLDHPNPASRTPTWPGP